MPDFDPYAASGIAPPQVAAAPVQAAAQQAFDPYAASGIAPLPQAVTAQPQAAAAPDYPIVKPSGSILGDASDFMETSADKALAGMESLPRTALHGVDYLASKLKGVLPAEPGDDQTLEHSIADIPVGGGKTLLPGYPEAFSELAKASGGEYQPQSAAGQVGMGAVTAALTGPENALRMASGGGLATALGQAYPNYPVAANVAGFIAGHQIPSLAKAATALPSAALQPLMKSGQENIVADTLLRSSSDPATLPARLQAGVDDSASRLPGAPATTAQVANDPGLMATESGLRSDAAASPTFSTQDAQRNAVREAFIRSLLGDQTGTDASRGQTIADALNTSNEGQNLLTGALYSKARAATPDVTTGEATYIPAPPMAGPNAPTLETWARPFSATPEAAATEGANNPLLASIASAKAKYFGPGSGGLPGELSDVESDVKAAGNNLTPEFLQNMYSRLGEIAGKASVAGNARLASAAGTLRSTVDEMAGTPELDAARAQRLAQGQDFGRNMQGANATAQILKTDRFGAPIMQPEAVAMRAVKDPASAQQTLSAAYNAVTAARKAGLTGSDLQAYRDNAQSLHQAMRDQFVSNLYDASRTTGNLAGPTATGLMGRTPQMSPAGFTRFWQANQGTAQVLFRPQEMQKLQQLASDFSDSTTSTATAKVAGSDTARNLSVANFIAKASGGQMNPGSMLAQGLLKGAGKLGAGALGVALGGHDVGFLGGFLGAGKAAEMIYGQPEAAMKAMFTRAMSDPSFAQSLLAKATPQSIQKVTAYMQNPSMMQRVGQFASATGQQAARAAQLQQALMARGQTTTSQGQQP